MHPILSILLCIIQAVIEKNKINSSTPTAAAEPDKRLKIMEAFKALYLLIHGLEQLAALKMWCNLSCGYLQSLPQTG